jgi:hypothetical protein
MMERRRRRKRSAKFTFTLSQLAGRSSDVQIVQSRTGIQTGREWFSLWTAHTFSMSLS